MDFNGNTFISVGHKDSVTCAGFSHDSQYVATGDMSGLIKVWKVADGQEVWSFETSDLEVSLQEKLNLSSRPHTLSASLYGWMLPNRLSSTKRISFVFYCQ